MLLHFIFDVAGYCIHLELQKVFRYYLKNNFFAAHYREVDVFEIRKLTN